MGFEHRNRFQPFAGEGDEEEVVIQEPQAINQEPEQANLEPNEDNVEPIEYEDDEPEELKMQKTCEAPTNKQRREHIESNHATYRGWCDVCINARATGTPHAIIKADAGAKKEAERLGPRIYTDYFYMSIDESSMPHLAFKFSRSGRLAATASLSNDVTEFSVKWQDR